MTRSVEYRDHIIRQVRSLNRILWVVFSGAVVLCESDHLYHCKRAIDTALENA